MKILIIADSFSPVKAIGAIRPSKFAKYLTKLGYDVTIITNKINHSGIDNILLKDQYRYGHLITVKNNLRGILSRRLRNRIIKSGQKITTTIKINQGIITPKNNKKLLSKIIYLRKKIVLDLKYKEEKNWAIETLKYINTNYEKNHFDVVFTSYGPASNLIVGKELYNENRVDSWIADFRDPMIQSSNSKLYKNYNALQKDVLKQAPIITTVSKGIKDYLIEISRNNNLEIDNSKLSVLYNGYDMDDTNKIANYIKDDKFKIVYCGTLYNGRRDLSVLFKILEKLTSDDKYYNKIEFHYGGNDKDIIDYWSEKYNISEIVYNHGVLSREDALALQSKADYIIAITWNGKESYEQGVIPGKIYETMMFDAKLLALILNDSRRSELTDIVENYNLGYAFDIYDDRSKVELELMELIKKDMKEKNANKSKKKKEKFDYEFLTKELVKHLESKVN